MEALPRLTRSRHGAPTDAPESFLIISTKPTSANDPVMRSSHHLMKCFRNQSAGRRSGLQIFVDLYSELRSAASRVGDSVPSKVSGVSIFDRLLRAVSHWRIARAMAAISEVFPLPGRRALPLLLLALVPALAAQTRFLRRPSWHAGKVVFSYRGDLWTAGDDGSGLAKLTSLKGSEDYARFSPDGKWVAFSWNQSGNSDVYVMPATGGEPRQLTFHDSPDAVVAWSPDGARILFQSARLELYSGLPEFGGAPRLYEVPSAGGLEKPLPVDRGYWGAYSPDGRKIVFNRNQLVQNGWRKHYRGRGAADLWVLDVPTGKAREVPLAGFQGNRPWPVYASNGEIYFVCDRLPNEPAVKPGSPEVLASLENLYKISERGGVPVQVTHHKSGTVAYPSISSDRRTIVYEADFGLWKLDTGTGKTVEIPIRIDAPKEQSAPRMFRGEMESFHISPDGSTIAFSVHGQIIAAAVEKGRPRRLTTTEWRDSDPRWSPDGKTIAFYSDRSGTHEIWLADVATGEVRRLTTSDSEKESLVWAPDSKSLAWSDTTFQVYRTELATEESKRIATSDAFAITELEFSPDGRWISYTKGGRGGRPNVYIIPSTGGKERAVSCEECVTSTGAKWTSGGELIFRGADSTMLRPAQPQLFRASLGGADREDTGKPAVRLTNLNDSLGFLGAFAVSPDAGACVYITTGGNSSILWLLREGQVNPVRLAKFEAPNGALGAARVSALQFSTDGRRLFFREGRAAGMLAVEPDAARQRISFDVELPVDPFAERRQMLREIMRKFRHHLPYPRLGGADGGAILAKYEALLEHVGQPSEFQDITDLMIGELNVSHARRQAPRRPGAGPAGQEDGAKTRRPGFDLVDDSAGFYRVAKVYPGGGSDQAGVRVRPGDYLLAIDGQPLKAGENYWKLLNGSADTKLELTLNSSARAEGAWTAVITPANKLSDGAVRYRDWVRTNRALVEKLSAGEIGYLHIRQMDQTPLREFEREFLRLQEKRGLILDVRFNPGGGTDQELLRILSTRSYLYTRRHSTPVEVGRPAAGFAGGLLVVQNEKSGSDSEIFVEGFRTLGLGPLVGTATHGAAIFSTSATLIDGSTVGIPNGAIISVKGQDLENNSRLPDVEVDNLPEDFIQGRDRQLEKAVEVMRRTLKSKS